MFIHMIPVRKEIYKTRNTDYELVVYQVEETGQYRIFVTNGEIGVGDIFTASQEVVNDAQDIDIVDELLEIAKDDVERNDFNLY